MVCRKWPSVPKTIAVICNLVMILIIFGCREKADPPDPVITFEEVIKKVHHVMQNSCF